MTRTASEITSELVASGLTPEQMALVLELTVAISTGISTRQNADTTAEKRRAWDRQRKAVKRVSGGNPVEIPVEVPPDAENALSLKVSSEIQRGERKKERAPRRTGAEIPPDWKPNDKHVVTGEALGFTPIQVESQAEDMRLWAQANEHRATARKSNWDAAFFGWMRRNAEKRSDHRRTAAGTERPATGADAIVAGMGRLARQRLADKPAAGSPEFGLPRRPDPAAGHAANGRAAGSDRGEPGDAAPLPRSHPGNVRN